MTGAGTLVATLVLAGPAWAVVPPCGSTIVVNTTLTGDMNCPGNGININASNITLDLNGHTITGPGPDVTPAPNQIYAGVRVLPGRTGVVIKNGTVQGFTVGLTTQQTANANEAFGLTLVNNGQGILTQTSSGGDAPFSDNNSFHDNTINASTGTAVRLFGNGHRFERNVIVGSGGQGLVVDGDGDLISGNRITNNAGTGINLIGNSTRTSDDNQLLENIVNSNAGSGIALAGNRNVAARNEVVGNMFNGIQLVVSGLVFADNRIESNTVNNNSTQPNFPGIFIGGSTNAVVSGNRVTGTGSSGIHIGNGSVGAQVVGNQVFQNQGDGIGLRAGSSGTQVQGNNASFNTDDGIDADVSAATLTNNFTNGNTDWGIETVSASVDGGGNHASGNGHAGQCQLFACLP